MKSPFSKINEGPNRFFTSCISRKSRLEGTTEIEDTIQRFGFIVDFHLFSDISLSLVVELNAKKILPLIESLSAIVQTDLINLPADIAPEEECTLFINITFIKNTGDKRNIIPAVPG